MNDVVGWLSHDPVQLERLLRRGDLGLVGIFSRNDIVFRNFDWIRFFLLSSSLLLLSGDFCLLDYANCYNGYFERDVLGERRGFEFFFFFGVK